MQKRLAKERSLLHESIVVEESAPDPQTADHYHCWKLQVPNKDTIHSLEIHFPKTYPFQEPYLYLPPTLRGTEGYCCNPHSGLLCCSHSMGLYAYWNPALTIRHLLDRLFPQS